MAIQKLNEKHTAIAIGMFAAVIHAVWAILAIIGSGSMFANWLEGIHFITEPAIALGGASIFGAVKLIVVAFIFGTILGWLFAKIWNWTAMQKWAK